MATKPVLLDEDGKVLGLRLTLAHLWLSVVLVVWLILRNAGLSRGERLQALDWQMAVNLLRAMHLPFTVAEFSGALVGFGWMTYLVVAGLLTVLGSASWGYCTAWIFATARRAFRA